MKAGLRLGWIKVALLSVASLLAVQDSARAVDPTHICPMFPYMFHGSYTSYYCVLRYPGYCADAASYNAPNNLPMADCEGTQAGCFPYGIEVGAAKTAASRAVKFGPKHHKDDKLVVEAPTFVGLAPGSTIIGTGVNIVEFQLKGEDNYRTAQVFVVRFTPPDGHAAVTFNVGYEIKASVNPDRSSKNPNEVEVEEESEHGVTLDVTMDKDEGTSRKYGILLLTEDDKKKS